MFFCMLLDNSHLRSEQAGMILSEVTIIITTRQSFAVQVIVFRSAIVQIIMQHSGGFKGHPVIGPLLVTCMQEFLTQFCGVYLY